MLCERTCGNWLLRTWSRRPPIFRALTADEVVKLDERLLVGRGRGRAQCMLSGGGVRGNDSLVAMRIICGIGLNGIELLITVISLINSEFVYSLIFV